MKKRIMVIIFIFLITFSLNVFAKEKVDLSIDKSSVESGDEITVSINFSEENEASYAYTAKLSYDEEVFETIEPENFEEQENWSSINYNRKNKKFALINKSGESGKKIVQLKLKVREEAKQGKTTISVENVTSTNGEEDIPIEGNSVEVQVGNSTQDTTPDEIKNNSDEEISIQTEKNPFKYFSIIPIVLCIFLIVFLVYINTKNKKMNKKQKIIISSICGIALFVLIVIAIIILKTEKTDINNDEVTDYDDANKIINYLLEIENPDEKEDHQDADEDHSQFDVNLDGEISTADLGRVLRRARNNTEYIPTITVEGTGTGESSYNDVNQDTYSDSPIQGGNTNESSGDQTNPGEIPDENEKPEEVVNKVENKNNKNQEVFQVQKSEQVELVFAIEITPKTGVKEVVIGGKTYLVKYNQNDNLYHVTIPTADLLGENRTYGKSTVELTEIILDNNRHIKLGKEKLLLNIEILKQSPTIVEEIEYNEIDSSITVTFDDPDNALKDGGYIYIETDNKERTVQRARAKIQTSKMETDGTKKKFTVNINEFENIDGTNLNIKNGDYNIFVTIPYQLDEDGILESSQLVKSFNNIHIVTDYKFTFSNLKVGTRVLADGNTVEDLTNTNVKLTFTSTNEAVNVENLPVTVSKVKVKLEMPNGEITEQEVAATPVEDSLNEYEIEVGHNGETKQTISIESVELSNGKTYIKQSSENTNNAEKTDVLENQKVTIFLSTPIAQKFTLNLGDEQTNMTVEYLLQDLDNTITKDKARLELIYQLSQEGTETVLDTIEVPVKTTENTRVDLGKKIADYQEKIPNYSYNKGNGIYIVKLYGTYATIDGKRHVIEDETGFIGMTTAIKSEPKAKRKPTVTAYLEPEENPNKLKINTTDPDGTFKTGTVIIKKSDGSIVKNESFTSRSYELILDKEYLENGDYTVEITYTYQLKENEEPITESLKPIELNNFKSDYGVIFVKIDDVIVEPKKEGVCPGQILLKFTATTKTENYIETIELDEGRTEIGEVTREGNQYTVVIPYESETTKTFQITKLILDNHYVENLDTSRADTLFAVYLEKPEIIAKEDGTQELQLVVDNTTKQPTAKVKIKNDQNGANYRARLTYPNSAASIEISLIKGEENEYTGTFGKTADVAGEYKLEILADYDLKNGEGLLQNQILGTTTYTADLEAKITEGSIQINQPTKGEIVTITYKVHDNTGKIVKSIEVNGKTYKATLIEGLPTANEKIFTVEVPVPLTHKKIDEQTGAPIVEFTATKLIYEGEEEELDPAFTFEQKVQNAKPKYENTLENIENQPQMKFHFTDPNGEKKAFRRATVKLKDAKGKIVKTREFSDIDKDYYFLLYEAQENESINGFHPEGAIEDTFTGMVDGEIYSIEVEIEYDVEYEVEGQENEAPGKVTDVIEGLQLNAEYNLKINTKQEETKVDPSTGMTIIVFTSSNALNAEIANVTIEKTVNGNTQTLSNLPISTFVGDKYTINLETNGEEEYKHEYNIKEVKLKTGVTISNFGDGSETKIITHFTAPIATISTPVINSDGTISARLTIKDPEKILTDVKAILYKKQGEQEVWKEEVIPTESNTIIEQEENGKDYTVNFKTNCNEVGTYIIKITGSYERLDGKTHINKEMANSNIETALKITNFTLSAYPYAEKNKKIILNVSVQDNTGSTIEKIEIVDSKGKTYKLEVTSNQAKLTTPENSGEITYTATKLYYADGTEISLENDQRNVAKVYVLKTEPKVEYKSINEDVHNPKIKVKVTDEDNTLKENKVTLKITSIPEGNKVLEQDIVPGSENELSVPQLEDKKQYKVEIIGTYDLDQEMGGDNYKENYNFLKDDEKIVGFQITNFTLDSIKVTNVSRTENYVEIAFNSTNNTYTDNDIGIYYVTHINVEGIANPIAVTKTTQNTEGFDTYTAQIPYEKIDEYRVYKITGAKVLGGKEFTSNDGFGTFEIFKKMPTAEITKARIIPDGEENAGKIEVKYKINTGLNSINLLKIKVLDKDGASKYVTSDHQVENPDTEETEKTVILNHIPKCAGLHTIQLLLTEANLNDGKTYGEQVLAENKDIHVSYSAQIVNTQMTVLPTKQSSTNNLITAAKGQEVQIDYEIKINRPVNERLNNITIKATGNEGKTYPIGDNNKIILEDPVAINETQETATYRIKVTVPQDAVAFENINYIVESVQFDTDLANTAKLPENTATIKVQKQEPKLLAITYDQLTRKISIKVQDEDHAITQGKIVVKDGETVITTKTFGTEATEDKIEPTEGVYSIQLENQENIEIKDYKVEVTGTYDVGNGLQELTPLDANLKIYNGEYDFTLSDVKVVKVENSDEDKFVYINFKTSNNHELPVKAVLVLEEELDSNNLEQRVEVTQTENGLEHRCEPEKIGDEYQIKIPFTNDNPKKYTITQVILDNAVAFDKNSSAEFSTNQLRVFKEKPVASELRLNLENKSAEFVINDVDSTIKDAKAVIINANTNDEIAEVQITNVQDKTINFPSDTIIPQGTYKLAIKATYDKLDGKGDTTEYIGMTDTVVEKKLQASITKIETDKKLYAKTEPVQVIMHVSDNTDYRIKKFYVHCTPENGEPIVFEDVPNYEEEPNPNGIYTFTTPLTPTAGEEEVIAGIRTCTVERIEYENPDDLDNPIIVTIPQSEQNKAQIEILKDTPTFYYKKQEKDGKTTLTVKLSNPDKADIVHNVEENGNISYEAGAIIKVLKLKSGTSDYEEIQLSEENKLIGTSEENKQGGDFTREIEIQENGTYELQINGIAYLADKLIDHADLTIITKSLALNQKEIKVVTNYDFKIENEKVISVDREAKTATIEFVSSNLANEIIKSIEIGEDRFEANTLNYEVVPQQDDLSSSEITKYKYTVTLTNIAPDLRQEILFRKAVLNDEKEFNDLANKIVIYKSTPSAKVNANIELKEGEDEKNVDAMRIIKGDFELLDAENCITKTYINVVKPDGTLLLKEPREQSQGKFEFEDSPINQKGDYKVQILADYDTNIGDPQDKQVIGEATVTINVDANIIKNTAENYYVQKGEEIKIHYTIEDNAEGTDRFKPNGVYAVITRDGKTENEEFQTITADGVGDQDHENEEYYTLTLKAPDTPQTIEIEVKSISYFDTISQTSTKALMKEEDKTKTKIDVLKAPITISDYAYDGKQDLRFKLVDDDNAFTTGRVKITKEGEEELIPEGELTFSKDNYQKGEDHLIRLSERIPTLEEEQNYHITIEADYDRTISTDEDLSGTNKNNEYKGTLKSEQNYHFIKDYNFQYDGEISLDSVDETTNKLTVSFDCSFVEDQNLQLTDAYILGKFYPVAKLPDGRYQVTIDFANNQDKLELKLLAVKFSNGRILKKPGYVGTGIAEGEGKDEQQLETVKSVYAFLTAPIIEDPIAEFNEQNKIHVTFKLNDPDKTVTAIKAQVLKGGSDATEVDVTQEISMPNLSDEGKAEVSFAIDKVYTDAGTYTVKLLFTYDRHGAQTHNEEVLSNSTLTTTFANWVRIEKDDRQGDNKFVERAEHDTTEIPIIYTILDNEEKEVKAIKLEDDDSKEYKVEKVAETENQYKAIFTVPTKSGKQTFRIKKVVYDQLTVELQEVHETTVEILKQKPTVKIVECNYNDRAIKFTINDPEDTITMGKAQITSEDGETVYKTVEINSTNVDEKEILVNFKEDEKGEELPTDKKLMLKVIATYKLDEEGEKVETDKELISQEIAPLDLAYNFELQDVKVKSVDRENTTAKLELTVKDNSSQMTGDNSLYKFQNFSIEGSETATTVQLLEKDDATGTSIYTADFSYPNDQDGKRQEYTINKVLIGTNEKEIETKQFILFKTKPSTQELTLDPEEITTESATATFKINDPDNALISAKVALYEYKYYQDYNQYMDIYMDEKEIPENEGNTYEIKLDGQNYNTNSKYTVKVEGQYDLADGNDLAQMEEEETTQLIGDEKTATKQFSIPIQAKVEEIKSTGGEIQPDGSIVVDKNKSISMYYRISDNTDLQIKKIILRDKNSIDPNNKTTWTATKVTTGDFKADPEKGEKGDVYRISYGGKSLAANAGVQDLEIKEIQYDRSRIADTIDQKIQKFKVRKLMPTVSYSGKGTLDEPEADFKIEDPDHAILNGKVNVEIYGTNDDVNNNTQVERGKRYLENANIELKVNEQQQIIFSDYEEDLPDGTYDIKIKGKYNLYGNEVDTKEYEVIRNFTVLKGAYFTFENLNIYPNLIQEMGQLVGLVNISSEKDLTVKGIKIRFYKEPTNTSDEEGTYVDYTVDGDKLANWDDSDLYTIMDFSFLESDAYKCIKIGQNPLKVLEVIATDKETEQEKIFKVNELTYINITRKQGQLAYFTIKEKTNINKEEKTVSTNLEGYITVNDLEDYYVPGSLTACAYDENGELIAEQPIDAATDEDKAKLQERYDEIDKMQITENKKSDLREESGYHKDIIFENIPIAKSYRVEIHGKWYQAYNDPNLGRMEEVQEGIVKMKHRTGIGAEASPSVDAKLNINASVRVGIEDTQTYVKNEAGEWTSSSYVGKGEDVKIEYLIRGNMDAGTHITSATINGKDVELSGVEGKVDVYETTVKAPEESGEFDINLTRVGLNTKDYKFTVDNEEYILNSTPVDVLTETPKIADFQVDYGNNITPKVSFDITEEKGEEERSTSKTIKKAAVKIYNYIDNNNESYKEQTPVKTYNLNTTESAINLAQEIELTGLATGTEYWLQIETDYSLVENTDSEVEGITKFSNTILYSSPFIIQADDHTKITNLSAPENVEKNQEIELKFNFQAGETDFIKPVKLKLKNNATLFDITEDEGIFKTNVTGYSISGIQEIELDEIVLNTGKVIKLQYNAAHKINVEICKDIIGVKDFSFKESGDEITLDVSLKDREKSLVDKSNNIQFEVYEEGSKEKIDGLTVEGSTQTLEYKAKFKSGTSRKYKCIIKAEYSKLQDGSNSTTEEIYTREFSLDDRTIEIKDITNIELMKFENGVTKKVEGLTLEELQAGAQYLVRVSMSNASAFYSDISYYEVKNEKLVLTLNYVGAKQYTNGEEGSITVELLDSNTTVNDHKFYVTTSSFTGLMYYLRNNPDAEVTLNHDLEAYDYSGPTDDDVYINKTFTGTIHGNGHTIKNIERPVFKEINGATIENLTFTNAVATAKKAGTGLLAGSAKAAKIKRVNFSGVNFIITNQCATMFASATNGTTIDECEVTGMTLTYSVTNNSYVGGLVDIANETTIKNCRVEGTIGGWPGWWQLGGVIGRAQNVTLENCVSNVDVNSAYGSQYTGGAMIGASTNLIMKNCATVSDGGNISPIIKSGQPLNDASTNNYACSALADRHASQSIKYQEQKDFTADFYKNQLGLDPDLWDFEGCGGEVLPKLKSANADKEPTTKNVEIPEYGRIKTQDGYDSSKEILYHNLSKLAPYYDSKYIVEDAKNISNNDDLNQKIIQGILPISKDGKVVNSLTNENYQDIAKIKLVFKDKTIKEYTVNFETYFGNVVCYNIPDLHNFKYNFKNYVINKDAAIVKELTDYVKNMNYVLSIDPLTKAKDSRLYSETFDDSTVREDKKYSTIFKENTVKQEAEQVIIDLLSNNNYNITNDDVKTASVIKNELLSNKRLERYLFTYTYVKRWYNINVEDFNLKDILLYHTDIFEGGLTFDIITNRLLLNDSNMATSATHTFYANNIGNTIGLSQIGDFIDFFIKNTEKYHDKVDDWLKDNFNGFIVETRLDNQDDRLRYRAWDYLKCWSNVLLPILRVPENSAYIYSCPTQIHIGATRVYYADPVKNADAMKKKMQNFSYSVKKNYETIYGMIGGGSSNEDEKQKAIDLFNRKNDIQTDTNIAYDGEYVGNKLLSSKKWQYANQTQEDYHKWFAEATGIWTSRIGSAAYAYGTRILWEDNALLDNFKIWSHETMHDQDGALILKNHNRRPAVGGEAYSDGFLTQSYEKPGFCKFNFPVTYDSNTSHTVNWTGDRISSPEKVEDYYSKAFELNYFLDYMVGQALFELTDSEQEKVLSKMPETETKPSRAGKDFKRVNTIQDLIDGQYAIDYGAEGYKTIRWYNPLSDVNYTSLDNLWVMAYEMLGYAGYDDGWLLWTTDILKNENDPYVSDQNALKEITKRKNNGTPLSIKEYKKQRFDEAAENADKLSYLNKDDIKKQFVETLKQDANEVKSDVGTLQMSKTSALKIKIFNKLKKYTDDLRSTPFGKQANNEEVTVTTGKDFIEEITKNSSAKIKLGNDIDLSAYNEGNSMIRSTFAGEINGDGKKITGVHIPIFESTLNAKFENFTIEEPQISLDKSILGALANTTESTTIKTVKVNKGSIDSKGKDTVGGLVGQSQESIFDSCNIEETTVTGAKNVGGLIGNASNINDTAENANKTTIKNCYSYRTTIQGTTKVGGLIGNLEKYSKIETSSSLETNVNGSQDSIGGLVGEINKGTIENSYTTGAVTGKRNYCGGLVGYATDPEIKYCYTTCTIKGMSNIGGFIGTVRNTGKIENSISIAIMENEKVAKFDTGSNLLLITNGFKNNYEIADFVGRPSSYNKVPANCIMGINYNGSDDKANSGWLNGLDNLNFWNHEGNANNRDYGVKFDNTIWKIPSQEELSKGELPTLLGAGNPKNTKIFKPQNIQS